jgi:hypothetical protein
MKRESDIPALTVSTVEETEAIDVAPEEELDALNLEEKEENTVKSGLAESPEPLKVSIPSYSGGMSLPGEGDTPMLPSTPKDSGSLMFRLRLATLLQQDTPPGIMSPAAVENSSTPWDVEAVNTNYVNLFPTSSEIDELHALHVEAKEAAALKRLIEDKKKESAYFKSIQRKDFSQFLEAYPSLPNLPVGCALVKLLSPALISKPNGNASMPASCRASIAPMLVCGIGDGPYLLTNDSNGAIVRKDGISVEKVLATWLKQGGLSHHSQPFTLRQDGDTPGQTVTLHLGDVKEAVKACSSCICVVEPAVPSDTVTDPEAAPPTNAHGGFARLFWRRYEQPVALFIQPQRSKHEQDGGETRWQIDSLQLKAVGPLCVAAEGIADWITQTKRMKVNALLLDGIKDSQGQWRVAELKHVGRDIKVRQRPGTAPLSSSPSPSPSHSTQKQGQKQKQQDSPGQGVLRSHTARGGGRTTHRPALYPVQSPSILKRRNPTHDRADADADAGGNEKEKETSLLSSSSPSRRRVSLAPGISGATGLFPSTPEDEDPYSRRQSLFVHGSDSRRASIVSRRSSILSRRSSITSLSQDLPLPGEGRSKTPPPQVIPAVTATALSKNKNKIKQQLQQRQKGLFMAQRRTFAGRQILGDKTQVQERWQVQVKKSSSTASLTGLLKSPRSPSASPSASAGVKGFSSPAAAIPTSRIDAAYEPPLTTTQQRALTDAFYHGITAACESMPEVWKPLSGKGIAMGPASLWALRQCPTLRCIPALLLTEEGPRLLQTVAVTTPVGSNIPELQECKIVAGPVTKIKSILQSWTEGGTVCTGTGSEPVHVKETPELLKAWEKIPPFPGSISRYMPGNIWRITGKVGEKEGQTWTFTGVALTSLKTMHFPSASEGRCYPLTHATIKEYGCDRMVRTIAAHLGSQWLVVDMIKEQETVSVIQIREAARRRSSQ